MHLAPCSGCSLLALAAVSLALAACGPDPQNCGLETTGELGLADERPASTGIATRVAASNASQSEIAAGSGIVSLTATLETDRELTAVWLPGTLCGQSYDDSGCVTLPRSDIVAAPVGAVLDGGIEVLARFADVAHLRLDDPRPAGNLLVLPTDPTEPYTVSGEASVRWYDEPSTCAGPRLDPLEAFCGDGVITAANETCDDENRAAGDGCDAICAVETPVCQHPVQGGLSVWDCPDHGGGCALFDCAAEPTGARCQVPSQLEVVTVAGGRWASPEAAPAVRVDGAACRCGGHGLLDVDECTATCSPDVHACTPITLDVDAPDGPSSWRTHGLAGDCTADGPCVAVAPHVAEVEALLAPAPHGVERVVGDLVGLADTTSASSPVTAVGADGRVAVVGDFAAPLAVGTTTYEQGGSAVVIYDGDSNRLAAHVLADTAFDLSLRDAAWTGDGTLVVAGAARGSVDFGRGVVLDVPTSGPEAREAFVAAWDATGTPLWARHLARPQPYTVDTLELAAAGSRIAVLGGLAAPATAGTSDAERTLRLWRVDPADGQVLTSLDTGTGEHLQTVDLELHDDGRVWFVGHGTHADASAVLPAVQGSAFVVHLDADDRLVYATGVAGVEATGLAVDTQWRPWVVTRSAADHALHLLDTEGQAVESRVFDGVAAVEIAADPVTATVVLAASHAHQRHMPDEESGFVYRQRRSVTVERVDEGLETVWVERLAWTLPDGRVIANTSAPSLGVDTGGRPIVTFDVSTGLSVGDTVLDAPPEGALRRAVVWLTP